MYWMIAKAVADMMNGIRNSHLHRGASAGGAGVVLDAANLLSRSVSQPESSSGSHDDYQLSNNLLQSANFVGSNGDF